MLTNKYQSLEDAKEIFGRRGKHQQTVYRISRTSLQTESSVMTGQQTRYCQRTAVIHIGKPHKPTHRPKLAKYAC
nr:hypothetical protein [Candidatus Brachybacter algidus]